MAYRGVTAADDEPMCWQAAAGGSIIAEASCDFGVFLSPSNAHGESGDENGGVRGMEAVALAKTGAHGACGAGLVGIGVSRVMAAGDERAIMYLGRKYRDDGCQ